MAQAILLTETHIFFTTQYIPENISTVRRSGGVIDCNGNAYWRMYDITLANNAMLLFQTNNEYNMPYAITQFATYHELHEIPDELCSMMASPDKETAFLGFELTYNFLKPKYKDTIRKRLHPIKPG